MTNGKTANVTSPSTAFLVMRKPVAGFVRPLPRSVEVEIVVPGGERLLLRSDPFQDQGCVEARFLQVGIELVRSPGRGQRLS